MLVGRNFCCEFMKLMSVSEWSVPCLENIFSGNFCEGAP